MLSYEAFLKKQAHESPDGITVAHCCFGGETEFLTDQGTKRLVDCVDQTINVLSAPLGEDRGEWTPAVVKAFGKQKLYAVTLKRNKQTKVVYATDNHRWIVRRPDRIVTTIDLQPEHRLGQIRLRRANVHMDDEGVRRGFHYGDGSTVQKPGSSVCHGNVALWGNKMDLAPYFAEISKTAGRSVQTESGIEGLRFSSGMKGYTKVVPPLDSDPAYLYGWLAGYFAADGCVTEQGQMTISCKYEHILEQVRDIATLFGIGTYRPTETIRQGYNPEGVLTPIYEMGFCATDLPEDFFLRSDHARNVKQTGFDRFGWTVVSVEPTDREEEVYCAVVPGNHSFALADNIHVGNCFCGSGSVIARSDGTIECEFCGQAFLVRIEPRYPAFPQTLNGQQVPIPGMPAGDPMGQMPPGAPGDPAQAGQDPQEQGDPSQAPGDPQDDGQAPPDEDMQRQSSLSAKQYLQHVALKHAGSNRERVLAEVRAENGLW